MSKVDGEFLSYLAFCLNEKKERKVSQMFIAGATCGYCGVDGAYVELVPFACLNCAPIHWPAGFPTKDSSLKEPPNYDGGDDCGDKDDRQTTSSAAWEDEAACVE